VEISWGSASDFLDPVLRLDGLPDPDHEVVGRLRPAFVSDDLFQPSLELGSVETGTARTEVPLEVGGPTPIELPMKEVLDLGQNLFAANL
jgi:hypothetical protein